jgi:hypothetical protein
VCFRGRGSLVAVCIGEMAGYDSVSKSDVLEGRNAAAAEGRKLFIGGISWETTDG